MRRFWASLVGLPILLSAPTAAADQLLVPSAMYPTIQSALTAAVGGDEVILTAALYAGPGNRDLDFGGKAIYMHSTSLDPAQCTIDVGGTSTVPAQAIIFDDGEAVGTIVEGITFTGAWSATTGAIEISNGAPVIRSCVISGNTADGVHAHGGGGATLDGVTIDTSLRVGARLVDTGTFTITDATISLNVGAGISLSGAGTVIVDDSAVLGNGSHGALLAGNGASFTATGTRFTGNAGSGVITSASAVDVSLTTSTIAGNETATNGGGVSIGATASATIERTILWGNCASGAGNDLYVDPAAATVEVSCSILDPAEASGAYTEPTPNTSESPRFCAASVCTSAPTTAGSYGVEAGSPALAAGSPCGQSIGALGQACIASCAVSSTALDFGTVEIGESADLSFTVRNNGAGFLNGDVTESCADFAIIQGAGPFALSPGDSVEVTVRFAPTTAGAALCDVSIGTTCPDVSASGTGAEAPVCELSTSSVPFGAVEVGQAVSQNFVVRNIGGGMLEGAISDAGCTEFSVTAGAGAFSIPAGDSVVVTVEYAPLSAGVHGCTITTGTECVDVNVSGTGTLAPVCELSRVMIDFGPVDVGSSSQETFAIRNVGGGTLNGSVSDAACTHFSVVGGGGAYAIAAGDSVVVTVEYTPQALGDHDCLIATGTDCTDVSVEGSGTAAPVCTVSPDALEFGAVTIGDFVDLPFTIKNTGGGTLFGAVNEFCAPYSIVTGSGAYAIPAGDSLVVTVRFAPESEGPSPCLVSTGISCTDVACNGTGAPGPVCEITPTSLDFGDVTVGSSAEQTFTIRNTGGGELKGSVLDAACTHFSVTDGAGDYMVTAGDSLVVTVTYAPGAAGPHGCTITTGDSCVEDVDVSGNGITPANCVVSRTAIDFGSVTVGAVAEESFTIRNTGQATLNGAVFAACVDYSITAGNGPYSLAAGDSVVVTVQFSPQTEGPHPCTVSTGTACADVICAGNGEAPAECLVSPVSLDFGEVTVGSSLKRTFTIKNVGGGTVNGNVTESCPDYTITAGGGPFAIASGDSVEVTVAFSPSSPGTHNCVISTGTSCADVPSTGRGQPAPACELSAEALDFGTVTVGESAERSYTIRNVGGGTLSGSVFEACNHFEVTSGGGPYALAGGDSVVVTVEYAPTVPGQHACDVNNGTECAVVACSGTAENPPNCAVIPASLDFGSVLLGESVDRTFNVKNTGGGTLIGSLTEDCDDYEILGNGVFAIGPGDSLDVTVRYTPGADGPSACTIVVSGPCADVSCSGTGIGPVCELEPEALFFGTVTIGDVEQRSLTIRNQGGGTIDGTLSEDCDDYQIVSPSNLAYSIAAGDSLVMTVEFAPTTTGVQQCNISTGGICGDVNAAGTGELAPECTLSATNIDFGTLTVGQFTDRTFTIENTGGGTLQGNPSAACTHFSIISGGGNYSLAAGESVTVRVRYAPEQEGDHLCLIDPGASCEEVLAEGVAEPPPDCTVSVDELDFGEVIVGSTEQQQFDITNNGGGTLTGVVFESCNHYTIQQGSGSYELGPGESRTVVVAFSPQSSGTHDCTISTGVSAGCAPVECTGRAVAAPLCDVSPESLDFGELVVGQSSQKTFTITNEGGGTLTGSVGAVCDEYDVVGGGGAFALGAGESRVVTVEFTPDAPGPSNCTVSTGSDCADVFSSGSAVEAPACEVSEKSLDFGVVEIGAFADRAFTIENTGGGTLTGLVSEACEPYQIIAGGGTFALAGGETVTVTVRFSPTTTENEVCTITTGTSCNDVVASGDGEVPPACTLTATELDFGTIAVGSSSEASVTVQNTGGGLLEGSVSLTCDHYELTGGGGSYSLASGETKKVTITYTPTAEGTHLCEVDMGAACSPVSCEGTAVPAGECLLSASTLSFGTVLLGESVDRTFTITNTGGLALVGDITESCDHYSIIDGGGPFTLPASESHEVTVRFSPESAGSHACTIETGTDCDDVECAGTGLAPPTCAINPPTLDFGTLEVGDFGVASFDITNVGGGQLIGNVSEGCQDYQIVSGSGSYALAAGATRTVTVRFAPTSPGDKLCDIQTGLDCPTLRCSGTGENPPDCVITPTNLDFSTVSIGEAAERTFTITNDGGGMLPGSVSASCEHFDLLSGSGPFLLGEGESVDVTVEFRPETTGTHECTITTGLDCVDVFATGVGSHPVMCSVEPTMIDFGVVQTNSTNRETFVVRNDGLGPISGSVSASCAPHFRVVFGGGAFTLDAGDSLEVTLEYEPTAPGNHSCTVRTGGICSPVQLFGLAEVPTEPVVVDPPDLTSRAFALWSLPVVYLPGQSPPPSLGEVLDLLYGSGGWEAFGPAGADSIVEPDHPVALGRGYWLRPLGSLETDELSGEPRGSATVRLGAGWSVVGSAGSGGSEIDELRIRTTGGDVLTLPAASEAGILAGTLFDYEDATGNGINDGGWGETDVTGGGMIEAWGGRLVHVYDTADAPVDLLYGVDDGVPARVASGNDGARGGVDWSIVVSITSGALADDAVTVGVADGASALWDPADVPQPPLPGPGLSLAIDHFDAFDRAGLYRRSFVARTDPDPLEWSLLLTGAGEQATLTWDLSALPPSLGAFLVLPGGVAVPMRELSSYAITAAMGDRSLRLVVTDEFGGPVLEADPGGLELVAPMPYTHDTMRIKYRIADTVRRARLRAFDSQGRVIRRFDSLPTGQGEHTVTWDGRNDAGNPIASGLYYIRLELDGRVFTLHQIVVR